MVNWNLGANTVQVIDESVESKYGLGPSVSYWKVSRSWIFDRSKLWCQQI